MRKVRDGFMEEMTFSKYANSLVDLFINLLTFFSRLFWRSPHVKMDKGRLWVSSI